MAEIKKSLVERLFGEHGTALQAFLYRRVRNHPDAAELAQEVYVRMLRVPDMTTVRNPEAYLFAVASNLAKEHAQRTPHGSTVLNIDDPLVQEQLAELPAFGGQLDRERRVQRLREVLDQLSPKCRLVTEEALLYYTWSQGFRAGGFNRTANCGCGSPFTPGTLWNEVQASRNGGWNPGLVFAPDTLTNNELGWKTMWRDRRIQWHGAIYQEDWNHAQISLSAPGIVDLGLFINGGNYRVRGIETSLVARLGSGFSVEAGGAWNQSELVKQVPFFWADGKPIDFSTLETFNNMKVPDLRGVLGSPLAGAPALQGNIRARYEWAFNGYDAFGQIGAAYQSHSLSTTDQLTHDLEGNSEAYELPAFTTLDGAIGVGKQAWLAQIYGENLTDTRAQLFANYSQYYKAITVDRPRTIGLRFSYRFRGR